MLTGYHANNGTFKHTYYMPMECFTESVWDYIYGRKKYLSYPGKIRQFYLIKA